LTSNVVPAGTVTPRPGMLTPRMAISDSWMLRSSSSPMARKPIKPSMK